MAEPIIYVAGPMTGIAGFNYPAFNAAAEELAVRGYEVLNPVDAELANPTPGTPQAWDWYMRRAIAMVIQADALSVLPGWQKSEGANLEVEIATQLGLDIRPHADWLKTRTDRKGARP